MTKQQVRKYVQEQHLLLTKDYYNEQQQLVITKIKTNKHFIKAKKIGIYFPLEKELNLLSLINEFPNKKFYFPKTINKNLSFKYENDLTKLISGPFGLKEPKIELPTEATLDLYLVPCVATYKNYRIGHGAGYYDYYFKDHKGYKIGVVLDVFKDLKTEVNDYDIPMDEII